jgi:hypothetical protein
MRHEPLTTRCRFPRTQRVPGKTWRICMIRNHKAFGVCVKKSIVPVIALFQAIFFISFYIFFLTSPLKKSKLLLSL